MITDRYVEVVRTEATSFLILYPFVIVVVMKSILGRR